MTRFRMIAICVGSFALVSALLPGGPARAAEGQVYSWQTFLGGEGGVMGFRTGTDAAGNVYVVGTADRGWNGPGGEPPLHPHSGSVDGTMSMNIALVKLDPAGSYLWHTFYAGRFAAEGRGVAVDPEGSVYLTGCSSWTFDGPDGQPPLHPHTLAGLTPEQLARGAVMPDIVVMKLDASGAYQWHTFYGGVLFNPFRDNDPLNSSDRAFGIALDGAGGVVVAGQSEQPWEGPGGEPPLHAHAPNQAPWYVLDVVVLKLDTGGAYQWHTFYGSPTDDDAWDVATDAEANVLVTGRSPGWDGAGGVRPLRPAADLDLFVLKLDGAGTYRWHTFSGAASCDWGHGVTADSAGEIAVVGQSRSPWKGPGGELPVSPFGGDGSDKMTVLKLSASGGYRWHTFHGSPKSWAADVAADAAGNLYVVGTSEAPWAGPRREAPLVPFGGSIAVVKLAASGAYRWHTFFDAEPADAGRGIALSGAGAIVAAGYGRQVDFRRSIVAFALDAEQPPQPAWRSFRSVGGMDGEVVESARGSGRGRAAIAGAATIRIGDDALDRQSRGIFSFDTSPLPEGATVLRAILTLLAPEQPGTSPFRALGALRGDIRRGAFAGNDALEARDFQARADGAAAFRVPATPAAGRYTADFNASARALINLQGPTQVRLRFERPTDGDRAADTLVVYGGDAAPRQRPMLEVQYLPQP